jgi:hypothetical protein
MLDDPGLDPHWGQEIFLIAATCLEPDKWPTQCPVMGPGALPRYRAAGTWCEDHPPPSRAKVEEREAIFLGPLCAFMLCYR